MMFTRPPVLMYDWQWNFKFLDISNWMDKYDIVALIKRIDSQCPLFFRNIIYSNNKPYSQQERIYDFVDHRLDEILSDVMDISMSHTIIGVFWQSIYLTESIDGTTNIDKEVMNALMDLYNGRFNHG